MTIEDGIRERLEGLLERAHCPYSAFPVAVIIRGSGGTLHEGVNVESAAFPSGFCAEKAALGAAVAALGAEMLPRAALLTPNLPEAATLLGEPEADGPGAMEAQGRRLMAMGPRAVLMKGGHGQGQTCVDLLVTRDGVLRLEAARIATRNTHGTGCSLSAAIAAGLARGRRLEDAVRAAHGWLQGAIRAADALGIGQGRGPVHHFHEAWA